MSTSVSKRVRIYTAEDVASNRSDKRCWVTFRDKVYDVTAFVPDHPGGEEFILENGGTDIENIMKDKDSHDHSDSAYEMLEEYMIGRLGTGGTVVSEGMSLLFLRGVFVSPRTNRLGGTGRFSRRRHGLCRRLCKDAIS